MSFQTSYIVENNGEEFSLFFSNIPFISIEANMGIEDDIKRPANLIYVDFNEIKFSITGIELRGGSSQRYPKKTYDLEFWEDETGENTKDMSFGSLREDDDWILDAMYNEPLRIRAYSAHQLWLGMHTLHYAEKEEEAKSGADVMYVDLFLNSEYRGIYMLSEQVDRKQLKIKKIKDDEVRGELYKAFSWEIGNATYNWLPDYDNSKKLWGDQELEYPKADEIIDWTNLFDFTDFVINSEVENFHENIEDMLDINNAIDYFIFLNITRATDNNDKNIYTAKYKKNSPYFFVPWDLDGIFGTIWTGDNENITNDILSNGLFDKLIYKTPTDEIELRVTERWKELRKNVLSDESLNNRLTSAYLFLKDNRIYERENIIWQNYPYDEASKSYMDNWISSRLEYLDSYFGINTLSTPDYNLDESKFSLYPIPTSDFIFIQSNSMPLEAFKIYNIQGALVLSGILNNQENKISLLGLSKGFYFVSLGNSMKKIIIE